MVAVSPSTPASPHPSVLLLEPDADTRHNYAQLLGNAFRVTAVDSSLGGLAHLVRTPPTVLVTDLILPDGDGLHICRTAKSATNAPAVLMTTSDVQRVPDAIEAGSDSILLNPSRRTSWSHA